MALLRAGVWLCGELVMGLPASRGLGKAAGDDAQDGGVPAEAAVAAFDFDVLDEWMVRGLEAGLPGHNTISAAVDGRKRLRRRLHETGLEIRREHRQRAIDPSIQQADVGLGGLARDGRADCDDLPNRSIDALGDFAGIDAAKTPADQRDRRAQALDPLIDLIGQRVHPCFDIAGRAGVEAPAPVVGVIAQLATELDQRRHGLCIGRQPGKHDDRMAVTHLEAAVVHQPATRVLHRRPKWLDAEQGPRRRRNRSCRIGRDRRHRISKFGFGIHGDGAKSRLPRYSAHPHHLPIPPKPQPIVRHHLRTARRAIERALATHSRAQQPAAEPTLCT